MRRGHCERLGYRGRLVFEDSEIRSTRNGSQNAVPPLISTAVGH